MVAQPPCHNLRISWRRLSPTVWETFIEAMSDIHALELCVKDKWHVWKAQKAKIEHQVKTLEEQLRHLEQKRRQYSRQQAEGIINEEELRMASKQIKSEEIVIREQLGRLEQFRQEPAPIDMATFKKLERFLTSEVATNLLDAPDDVKARYADTFDLHATIRPKGSKNDFLISLYANIPLEMEGDKPGAYDMVFRSSGCLPFHAYVYNLPQLA
jgi:hypothetical protein